MLFWRRKKKNDMDALFDQMGNTIDAVNDLSNMLEESTKVLESIRQLISEKDQQIAALRSELDKRTLFNDSLLMKIVEASLEKREAPKSAVADYIARRNGSAYSNNKPKLP